MGCGNYGDGCGGDDDRLTVMVKPQFFRWVWGAANHFSTASVTRICKDMNILWPKPNEKN